MVPHEPIAIIGTGCRFPGGANSPSKLWKLLQQPPDLSVKIPQDRFNVDAFYHSDGSHFGTTNVKKSYFLEEDPRRFDNQFFNVQPAEAEALDPQQRLLLETVYDAVESSGLSLESLKGSNTAVYVGLMNDDYSEILRRDLNALPTYAVTGTAKAIMSNRISYFFDWHGPSMTIDTACSSSMVAIHQAVQTLRSKQSRTAVAAGANLIFGPEAYISESNLHMLSPSGHSQMWDAEADGYARGEATGALVLKCLSDALEDGDHIECIIRETGVNSDGRTKGITMPSETSQSALIRDTYLRAGLDLNNKDDRCQYFEAHGTGTAVGDPKEAEAIAVAFFGLESTCTSDDILYVGSIKTVIGHTEGTAGIAGVIKASLAMQHGIIPPNLHFNKLNPAIEPFYTHLKIPTTATPWPTVPAGQPKRASVNSFGLGGTNGHAILESYEPLAPYTFTAPILHCDSSLSTTKESLELSSDKMPHNCRPENLETRPCFTTPSTSTFLHAHETVAENSIVLQETPTLLPFVFSATSERSLIAIIRQFCNYIKTNKCIELSSLAHALARRSSFAFKAPFSASTAVDLVSQMESKLALLDAEPSIPFAIRSSSCASRILGIFTGQGAQWATMGRELLKSSKSFRQTITELENSLAQLQERDRPTWSLHEEIVSDSTNSRIGEAALSQPLCTAIQIALVNLLHSAALHFEAVVGHSSGEIAAAYAAGFISAYDAIRIAYYRGLVAKHACGPDGNRGAMIAVGASYQHASDLCSLPQFEGRISLAASNSSSSVTLSGDLDAVNELKAIFDEQKRFARILKIDTAYHSHHMLKCSNMYMQALRACNIQAQTPPVGACSWYSSVYGGMEVVSGDQLKDTYWTDNMVCSVLFSQALQCAIQAHGSFDIALEIGPHPALKAPVQATFQELPGSDTLYCGTLTRGLSDVEAFSATLGFLWSHLGQSSVDLSAYGKTTGDGGNAPKFLRNLPSYVWDHERVFWSESRRSMLLRTCGSSRHELLGSRMPESVDGEIRWINFLSPNELPWIDGHVIQGQKVFPAAGYVSMAIEAAMIVAGERNAKLVEIEDLKVLRALGFDDDTTGIETMFTLSSITSRKSADEVVTANFACYSCLNKQAGNMIMMASGAIRIILGTSTDNVFPARLPQDETLTPMHTEPLYASLAELGYVYSGAFKAMSSMRRKMNKASGLIANPSIAQASSLLVHPAVLDAMFQTMFVAYCSPYDGRLWSLHLPTGVQRITIDPSHCGASMGSTVLFDAESANSTSNSLSGDVDIFTENGSEPIMKVEGMRFKPFSEATAADDSEIFSEAIWGVAAPDGTAVTAEDRATEQEIELGYICERVAYYYYRSLLETVAVAEREKLDLPAHHRSLFDFTNDIVSQVSEGRHPFAKAEWNFDSKEMILEMMSRYPDSADFHIMRAVGENLPAVIRGQTTILEHMTKDGLLDDYYKRGLGFESSHKWTGRMVAQIAHRYPHMKILEIGAGTGGSTKKILPKLDRAFSSYTYTDVSAGYFEKAQDVFKNYINKMRFKLLDIEKDPAAQGFEDHAYDLIIAANVLHATKNLEQTMTNVRRLLKPGGYLVLLEVTNNGPMRIGFVMSGLPGWWVGADSGRKLAPTIALPQWDSLLKKTGFSGFDSSTPENDPLPYPASVFVTQAMDHRTTLLRNPLASVDLDFNLDYVVILGGESLQTAQLADELAQSLQRYCKHVIRIERLDTLKSTHINPMTSVISFTELDEPMFSNMTETKWETLKLLLDLSRNVLWVTHGCLANEPYSNMTVGLFRSICYELPHLQLQLLDIGSADELKANMLSEMLLRLHMKDSWEKEGRLHDILWTTEPEYILEDGKLKVLRMMPSKYRNNRYNASRRLITKTVPAQSLVRLDNKTDDYFLTEMSQAPSPVMLNGGPSFAMYRVEVEYSISAPIMAQRKPALFLCLGITTLAGVQKRVLGLSDISASVVNVLESQAILFDPPKGEEARYLVAISRHLLSLGALSNVTSGNTVILNDPEPYLVDTLQRRAAEKNICLTLTTACQIERGAPWVSIHPKSSKRVVNSSLPDCPLLFIDFGTTNSAHAVASRIREFLPTFCKERAPGIYLGDQDKPTLLMEELERAVTSSRLALCDSGIANDVRIVPLKEVAITSDLPRLNTAIDWTSPSPVSVKITPADSGNLFFKDKTYLLVGLTRDLGQSLCEWMLTKGAKNIVIASRNPQVNLVWLESLTSRGAVVKVMSMDITNRDSVLKVYSDICKTMPPIGGVANGAMVLRDTSFPRMSYEELQTVLKPKVQGTQYLDEIFSSNTLDFFILCSSLMAVLGNSGQSNYSAANMFMTSLAAQRRKRGLAASVMNISGIFGAGYVSRVDDVTHKQLAKIKFRPMSEQDFHQMFAEAVLGGTPESGAIPEFTAGLREVSAGQNAAWGTNPRFSHFIRNVEEATIKKADGEHAASLKNRLLLVRTKEEGTTLIEASFATKVQSILLLESSVDSQVPLLDLGVDSLVAVEVRSWFMKELQVDMPVLKVLGGASVSDLVGIAFGKLQSEFIPNISSTAGGHAIVAQVGKASSVDSSDESGHEKSSSSDVSVTATSVSTPDASEHWGSPKIAPAEDHHSSHPTPYIDS